MKTALGKGSLTWKSEVVMKPIEEVAKELEGQGWRIIRQSEGEAVTIRSEPPEAQDVV